MEVSRCCWRVISAKVCPSQGTHTHTLQSKLKPKNETAAGNVDSAQLIRQGKWRRWSRHFYDRRTCFLSAENVRENVLLAHFSMAVIKWSRPRMNTIKIIY